MSSEGNQVNAIGWIWSWLNNPENNPGMMFVIAVIAVVVTSFMGWLNKRSKRNTVAPQHGQGGRGGSASVNGNGVAIGGRGGRGGFGGGGGDGGGGELKGSGIAIGGDGGDAGLPWRPVLGGVSATERLPLDHWSNDLLPKDDLGMMLAGRGGASGSVDAVVQTRFGMLRLLDLLRLIDLWSPSAIDEVDQSRPKDEQAFWDLLQGMHPQLADRAEKHILACQEAKEAGMPPPNPYN